MRLVAFTVLVDLHGGCVQLGNARHGPRPFGGGFVRPSFDQQRWIRVGVVLGFDLVVRHVGRFRGVHVVGEHLLRGLIPLKARGHGIGEALRTVRVASNRIGIGVLAGRFAVRCGRRTGQDWGRGGYVQRLLFEPFLDPVDLEIAHHFLRLPTAAAADSSSASADAAAVDANSALMVAR